VILGACRAIPATFAIPSIDDGSVRLLCRAEKRYVGVDQSSSFIASIIAAHQDSQPAGYVVYAVTMAGSRFCEQAVLKQSNVVGERSQVGDIHADT
jgi:hypothetical protein